MATDVQRVRAFNRTVADRIGALSDGFLGRGRPMGESRVLWEIGLEGCEVRELRNRLGLDSGYASRVLQSLSQQGLITLEPSATDGRVRFARLTRQGQQERQELDQRSDAVAFSLLEPLDDSHRKRLVEAMSEVQKLLTASRISLAVEDPTTEEARWCIQQYFEELAHRFEFGFDSAKAISAEPHELVPPHGLLVIARLQGRPVGCGALKFQPDHTAYLKRMWVAPEVRGLGLGRRMLSTLEHLARQSGANKAVLETNRALTEAIQLYRGSGYHEVPAFNDEPYAHYWFEKSLEC